MSATVRPATMKGPAIFLAQFIGDAQPFDSFDAICGWAAGLGYKGVQVPTSDPRLIDIDKAAASQIASGLISSGCSKCRQVRSKPTTCGTGRASLV